MIGVGELTTYWREVPSTGRSCGAPSKMGWKLGPFTRGTVAVWGMEFSITASWACDVPATDESTTPAGEQHVEHRARGVEDHVGVGVGRPVERGALDGGEGRLALEDDQLGRRLAHVDGGHAGSQG